MHLYLAHYVTNEILAAALATADALSLFASAEERDAARIAICLAWIGAWRDDAGEGDRHFAYCPSSSLRSPAGSLTRERRSQSRCAISVCSRDLFRGVRLVLRADLAEVRYSAARQLGCDQRVHLVAGSRLSHCSRLPSFWTFVSDIHSSAGFAGFADGIYSTLWGDAFVRRRVKLECCVEPEPLIAGYLWALIPTALILVGAVVAVFNLFENPRVNCFCYLVSPPC